MCIFKLFQKKKKKKESSRGDPNAPEMAAKRGEAKKTKKKLDNLCTEIKRAVDRLKEKQAKREVQRAAADKQRRKQATNAERETLKQQQQEIRAAKALERETEKQERHRKLDEDKRARAEARKEKLLRDREAREAAKKKDQEDRRLIREADRQKRHDEKQRQKDAERELKEKEARDRGKEDMLFPFQQGITFPAPTEVDWDPCIKDLVDVADEAGNAEREKLLLDGMAILEFFCAQTIKQDQDEDEFDCLFGQSKELSISSTFSFADVTRTLFGKDQDAVKLAFRMHKIMLLIVFEEDLDKRVMYTEWFAELPITVVTFQAITLKFLETHKLFLEEEAECVTSFRTKEYSEIAPEHKLTVLKFLRDQSLLTERARRQLDSMRDEVEEHQRNIRRLEAEQQDLLRMPHDENLASICNALYTKVLETKRTDERSNQDTALCPVFMDPVPREMYPDYYKLIEQPFSLSEVKAKIDGGNYTTFEECYDDFMLIWGNAMIYNQLGSLIYGYAKELKTECEGMKRFLSARFMLMKEAKEAKEARAQKQQAAAAARAEAMAKAIAEGRVPPSGVVAMEPGALGAGAAVAAEGAAGGGGEGTLADGSSWDADSDSRTLGAIDGSAESATSPDATATAVGNGSNGTAVGRTQPSRSRRSRANSRKLESYSTAIAELREKAADKQRGTKVESLGRDRFMNRYFMMNSLPGIHVQARLLFSGEDSQAAADCAVVKPEDAELYVAAARPRDFTANESDAEQLNRLEHERTNAVKIPWGRITKEEDYEMLVSNLNPQGARESSLLTALKGRRQSILKSLETARMQEQFPVTVPVETSSGIELVAKATGTQLLDLYKQLKKGGQINRRNQWQVDEAAGDFDQGTWKEQVVGAQSVVVMTELAKVLAEHVEDPQRKAWENNRDRWFDTLLECQCYSELAFHMLVFEKAAGKHSFDARSHNDQAMLETTIVAEQDEEEDEEFQDTGSREICRGCFQGGQLVWCDSCPNCYHKSCIKDPVADDADWFCGDCKIPRQLVWAKIKGYSKWPAKVIEQNGAKYNLWFFGTHEILEKVGEKVITAFTGTEKDLEKVTKLKNFKTAVEEVKKYHKYHRILALKNGTEDPTVFVTAAQQPKNHGPCTFNGREGTVCTMTNVKGSQFCAWHTGRIPGSPFVSGQIV